MSTITIQKISITKLATDAVVNAANSDLRHGTGVCGYIFQDAGAAEMTKACNAIGHCNTGSAVITPGFHLPAKYVIHAVGPIYSDGNHGEPKLLYSAYYKSLSLAKENGLHSIGFPLISAGIYGYPKDEAWGKALEACRDFLVSDPDYEMDIVFAVLDDQIKAIGERMLAELDGPIKAVGERTIVESGADKKTENASMKLYDISQEVFSCAVYPGDPSPEREVMLSIADGSVCNLTAFRMCAHNGTHVDAPYHFLNDGKKLDQVDLNRFVGPAYVAEAEGEITADIARQILQEAQKCDAAAAERILVKGKAVVTLEAAEVFAEAKLKLFGNESQTVGPEDAPMQVHLTMLGAEIVLLEGIRLAEVPVGRYLLCAAPINLGGADGAPCRAVLIDLDHPYPHCGFEGPTIGEVLPEGTILVSEGDGCVREVRPNDPEWRMLAIERGMLKAEIPDGSLRTALYGAILGDMIGSPYEFDQGDKTKDFILFDSTENVHYTDDSAMTLAIAKAITEVGPDADEATMKQAFVVCMQDFGRRYAKHEYGGHFYQWLYMDDPKPYGSYGNGSAMRVSSVGWCYDTIERTREVARWSAEVTHNHPEGIKGAESVAAAIFLLRNGSTKEEVKEYIVREFGYDLSRTCDEIRPYYHHVESCQETVPEAITAFLESTDFEDAIRTAVSLGGDCDTLTCITGSLAEACYGVPDEMIEECEQRLPDELLQVLKKFRTVID